MDKSITKSMLQQGYEQGIVRLINSPQFGGTVCEIGEYWLYFGGFTAEENSVEDYIKIVPTEDIIDMIYRVLKDFKTEFEDEYLYYYYILKEQLK